MHRQRIVLRSLVLLVALVGTACEEATLPPIAKVIRPVRYQHVVAMAENRARTFAGTAQAGEETRLSFRVVGTIQRLRVKVGDGVQRGALVAELDPKDYVLRVQEAEASLARRRAEARNAAADYSRTRALYANKNASRDDLDAARAAHESAKAGVRAATTQLEQAHRQVAYTRLTASATGAIADVLVGVNENVQAGQVIVLLASGDKPEVRVAIPEAFIARIARGDRVTVTFDALPGQRFPARVTEVGVAATGTATTFPVTVQLDAAQANIRSGLAANVAFTFATPRNTTRFVVPVQAVGEDQQGRFVYLVERQEANLGIVHRHPVTVGALMSAGLEIRQGLQGGELLVTAGVKRLEDGQEVTLLATPPEKP